MVSLCIDSARGEGEIMKKKAGIRVSLVVSGVCLVACASTIPISSNLNDAVLFGIRTNRQDAVSFAFVSNIQDGEMPVLKYEGSEGDAGSVVINEGAVLKNMVSDYMAVKFSRLSAKGEDRITFTLKEFVIRDWSTLDMRRVSVKLTAALELRQSGGETETKTLIATSERRHIGQVQTQQNNSSDRSAYERNYDKQFISPSRNDAISFCVNDANNKLMLQLNSFFDDIKM